jgi:hypothetical protein
MAVYCENHIELISTMFVKIYSVMMLKQTYVTLPFGLEGFQPYNNKKYGIAYNGC